MVKKVGYPKGVSRKPKGTTAPNTIKVNDEVHRQLKKMRIGKQTMNDVLVELLHKKSVVDEVFRNMEIQFKE